jgi:hypothetical protein
MKRIFALAAIVLSALPALASAAYNDVTLTTSAAISVGGYTLDVSGASAAVQSIVVNASNFSVTLASGSLLTVSSPTLNQLSSNVTSDVTSNPCTGSASSISLAYSGAGTATNVITPSATICTTAATSPSSGGGGPIYGSGPLAPGYVNANPTATSTAAGATPNTATSTAASVVSRTSSYLFTQNLYFRSTSPEVAELQKYLNDHGFPVAESGPGSPGEETDNFGLLTYMTLIKYPTAWQFHGVPPW